MADTKTKSAVSKPATAAKKAPVAKKAPAAKKPAVKSAKPAAKKSAARNPGPQERYSMVQVAAYFIAERNNFVGNPLEFWTAAEAEVKAMLAGK
jgi:hypothetical protein